MNDVSKRFERNRSLASYCTYQIGGPADYFFEAASSADLVAALDWAHENGVRFFVFGGGSNLLFDDAGFRGLVIRVVVDMPLIVERGVGVGKIRVAAGIKISSLVRAAFDEGLTGLEEWNGLPGTVGGAVFGNAGCFGVETKDVLESAVIWEAGEVREVGVDFFEYAYRDSRLKRENAVVLEATFKLGEGDKDEIWAKMLEIAKSRVKKQPAGSSTGSFFKNPPGEAAGRLIDECGLKGKRQGGAMISEQHANFFLNTGGATAKEILELGKVAASEVKEKFGIELEREVVYVAP